MAFDKGANCQLIAASAQAQLEGIRKGLEGTKGLVGVNGTYTLSAEDHGGYDPKAVVLIEVANGKWSLVK